MRVTLLARYPRIDTVAWKLELASRLRDDGIDVSVAYTRANLADQARAGLKKFGSGMLLEYVRARGGISGGAALLSLSEWARTEDIPLVHHAGPPNADFVAALGRLAPDLLLLTGADIVPRVVLDIPQLGTLNPHYAFLPRYRGMNVAEWSIYQDDPLGVSVHFVDEGIDTGDIVARAPIEVEAGDRLANVRAKQQRLAGSLLRNAVAAVAASEVERVSQRPEEGKQYYRMHPVLLAEVERKLEERRYAWLNRESDQFTSSSGPRSDA